jgi:hypothetical protein
VQDGEEADLAAEVPRIGGEGLERCGHGIEQYRIDDSLVVKGDLGDFGGLSGISCVGGRLNITPPWPG